jgi:hypothetical protein
MSDELKSPGVQRLRAVLDDSAAALDASTLSRLNRARQAALAARRSHRRFAWPLGLALAGGLMLAVLIVRMQPDVAPVPVVHIDLPKTTVTPAPVPAPKPASLGAPQQLVAVTPLTESVTAHTDAQTAALDAADLPDDLLGDDTEGLAQEDLEFYAWLDAQEAQDG